MKLSILSERKISTFPLSIGTSFAMEAFQPGDLTPYDFEREQTPRLNPGDYDELWVNIVTLFRNMVNSIASGDVHRVTAKEYAEELLLEVDLIRDFMKSQFPLIRVVFYSCSYKGLKQKYPHADLAASKTPKQKLIQELTGQTLTYFYRKKKISEQFCHFELDIKARRSCRALMLTHYAHDLTCEGFSSVDLLESHTGIVKGKSAWWTKFTDKRTQRIPLCKLTLQVFGDSTLFYMHKIKIRDELIDIAEKNKWTYATTDERIRLCLNLVREPYAREVLMSMV